jgi:hypothetical protein
VDGAVCHQHGRMQFMLALGLRARCLLQQMHAQALTMLPF